MRSILCIDFGTSSIRAAIGQDDSRPLALELGEAFRSSIDRASIPSAVFIDAEKSMISFGEEGLKQGLRGEKSFLFEMSPKRWMTAESPAELDTEIIRDSGLTRKHLLAGLLSQAFSATAAAKGYSKVQMLEIETRVAHPVWNPTDRTKLGQHLKWITDAARLLCGITDKPIPLRKFIAEIKKASSAKTLARTVDVEEPVAAALELFENSDNSREICVVIDVGAGTTDLGMFVSLTPDEQARGHRRKFIQAAAPKSIYMAGDLIDEEVISVIKRRAGNLRNDTFQDLQRRRRSIKETLFSRTGKIFEAGVEITLSEIEKQPRIRDMGKALSSNFRDMIVEASSFIRPFVEATLHRADHINVVFAGGGGKISFLHQAIGNRAELMSGNSLPILIRPAIPADRALPATVERLAVALGGTTPNKYWPVTELLSQRDMTTQWDRGRQSLERWSLSSSSEPTNSNWWREQE